MQKVIFGTSGQEIQGTLITPKILKKKNPGVILIHGFGSSEKNYLPLAQRLAEKGIVALAINLRGHVKGASENNTLHVRDGFQDGEKAYDFLVQHEFIDRKRIGMCGSSFGGGISAYVSGVRNTHSLVLRAPATYTDYLMSLTLKDIMAEEGEKFNKMENISKTLVIKRLKKFTGSLLVISSEKDFVIPAKMTQAFFDAPIHAKMKDFIEMKDATHALDTDVLREEFRSLATSWFQKTLL